MDEQQVLVFTLLPVQTIQSAFYQLGYLVKMALRTQEGDRARLDAQKQEVLQFVRVLDMVRAHICPGLIEH